MNSPNRHPEESGHGTHGSHENGGFEHEDLGPRTVYIFLGTLALVLVASVFVANGTYHALDRYFQTHQPVPSPMRLATHGDTRDLNTPAVTEKIETTFPRPLLEDDERNELTNLRTQEDDQLDSYGWIDQKAGTAHIPIERAMQLTVQRGLPVRPADMNAAVLAKTAPAKAAAGKKAAANAAAK